ncbi:MAG: PDZ domain-containing protein [Betaproteobacteria bacterium]|nr:PDZ domain-containing protein [Betaproteobacteria bacterium]MCC6248777.1 PDZ domain-containing protein [Rubrivivax sp.]MCL4698183.1 PDZ domain-containing protein [Burkholderiaceae bacterium]
MPHAATRSARPSIRRLAGRLAALGVAALLAACGGHYDDDEFDCSQRGQKAWLGDYMNEWYFWYAISPRPNPASFTDVLDYYDALLYTGGTAEFPAADVYSRSESTESFNRFYGDGRTLGYGVAVNGFEVRAGEPLYVRYVEPASDAAVQGVQRGDEVLTANGRTAAELIAADDYSVLSAGRAGDRLTLQLRRAGVTRTVIVEAKVFDLTPTSGARVVLSPNGRRLGYLMVKDMLSQAQGGLSSAFTLFRSEGVQDLVLDLRYNGGGLVSVGAELASYVAGQRAFTGSSARTYTALLYNDKRARANNQSFHFQNVSQALGLPRVYLLTGPRTASAAEQVINGLRGIDVQVVSVGDTTFGKPVGSLPAGHCGTTYSAVNFESANARNEGRFFDGFDATCPVAEDFTRDTGALDDPLLVTAAHHADNGACPAAVASAKPALTRAEKTAARRAWRIDEREAMLPR